MTELVRTVPSGIVGLDLALGGGPRFVRRTHTGDRESATIVVRGGPGAGKSVLAQDLALRLASALGGDVLYACVEVLPSEILAQRQGFQGFDPARAVDLSETSVRKRGDVAGPCLVVGLRDVATVDKVPDLGQALLDLHRIAAARGFVPKVVVVDSLSDGYHLGSEAPRELVDGICKLAIEQGWALILVEEATSKPAVSPWCFAVDTVLALRVSERDGLARRELTVAKHRFAGCEPGPHRLMIEPDRVRVIPPLAAYRNAARVLQLPPPSSNRSLRIPVEGPEPDWTKFDVPNGKGRCVVAAIDTKVSDENGQSITSSIGGLDANGAPQAGARITFFFREQASLPFKISETGFMGGTLHQLIDGAEWLEEVLTRLVTWNGNVSRIRVGPLNRLSIYEHQDDLLRAVSLFAALLRERGFVVMIFGNYPTTDGATAVIRAGLISDHVSISRPSAIENPQNKLVVQFGNGSESIRVTPVM